MKSRCFNPQSALRHAWRPRHRMDPLWRRSFLVFRAWSAAHGYEPGLALNRIDKRKGYTPETAAGRRLYSRSHDTRPVTRSDGRRFESLSEAVRETPRAHA